MIRERIEWSQFYWFDSDRSDLKRVLLIGDSIVAGSRDDAAKILAGKATVAAFSTSKIVGDPAIQRELMLALADYPIDFIYFNNGLHGLDYDDAFYRRGLEEFIDFLTLISRAGLCWRHSTPITVSGKPEEFDVRNEVVIRRNAIAAEVMGARGIPVDDMYGVVANRPEISSGDGFHYTAEGNRIIAGHAAETITRLWL